MSLPAQALPLLKPAIADPVGRSLRRHVPDVLVGIFTTRLAWQEYLAQSWFVARVSLLPAVLMMIPYR